MTDQNQNEPIEREEEIRDLDVPEEQTAGIKGGSVDIYLKADSVVAKPKLPGDGGPR